MRESAQKENGGKNRTLVWEKIHLLFFRGLFWKYSILKIGRSMAASLGIIFTDAGMFFSQNLCYVFFFRTSYVRLFCSPNSYMHVFTTKTEASILLKTLINKKLSLAARALKASRTNRLHKESQNTSIKSKK